MGYTHGEIKFSLKQPEQNITFYLCQNINNNLTTINLTSQFTTFRYFDILPTKKIVYSCFEYHGIIVSNAGNDTENADMKKAVALRLCIVIAVSMFAAALLSCYVQMKVATDAMYANSLNRIEQVSQILENNDADVEKLRESLREDYFIRAEAAAYIVQNNPSVVHNLAEMKKIAALLQVDELHLFDTEGTLYAGSEPKYYNYNFHSGVQMQFFLPMLENYDLQLCQNLTPNTAEGKQMQYLAVWSKDHKSIIQIGMEPTRLLDAMKKNEISHIFSLLTVEKGITIFAVDPKTYDIIGSTNKALNGKNSKDIGLYDNSAAPHNKGFVTKLDDETNYCVMAESDDVLVGVSSTYSNLYQAIPNNMAIIILSLCFLSAVIILLILSALDKYIIRGIYSIIGSMKKITEGDLDLRIEEKSSPEFTELGNSINALVMSLLNTNSKLSLIFQYVNIPIAAYEYNQDMTRVMATSKLGEILMLSDEEVRDALADRSLFFQKIHEIHAHPYHQEKDIYVLSGEKTRYVKIKSYQERRSTWGIIVDVTEDMVEKQRIKYERDVDLLTGLSSRRAFFDQLELLYQQPELLKTMAILMTDVDNLKHVNDNWGHEYGDQLLVKAAELLKGCTAPHTICARLSGDEFVLVIYGADSEDQIKGYLNHLHNEILHASMELPDESTLPVRLSGGYIFSPSCTEDYREMLRLADQAMYQVKRDTKGYFAQYIPPSN